jgi:DNA-binding IclR family transcriptional regulator
MKEPRKARTQRHRALTRAVETSKAPAIARASAILRLLGRSDTPLGVQSIARELGLVPSTCHYVLRALASEELVAFDPETKRYALDAGVLTLAQHWLRRNRFNELAQPVLDELSNTFNVTTLGVQIVGLEHIVVVAVSQATSELQLSTQIGSRFPALISATGRCIAAFGDHADSALEARFRMLRWDEPPTWEAWRSQVEQTRADGIAVDAGHYIAGVTVIAAPVWRTRLRLSHALVAIGIGSAVRRAGIPELQRSLLAASRALSDRLCGDAQPVLR